ENSLLEAEDEDDVEPARAGAHEVEHGDLALLARRRAAHRRPLERADEDLRPDLLAARRELLEQTERGVVDAQVVTRLLPDGRRLEPVRRAQHRLDETARALERRVGSAQLAQHGQRGAAQPLGLLLHAGGVVDCAAAQPSLHEVDRSPGEAGEGRAEEGEQVLPRPVEPYEAEDGEERVAERRLAEPRAVLDGVRDAEGRERGLERRAPALERGAHDGDPVGRDAAADQLEELLADELEDAADARALEEADRPLE